MYSSFAVNIIMAASFQLLWGMLNVIQLIINMPLLNVDFPSNTVFFYSLLMTMAQFDILPSKTINANILIFDTSTMSSDNVPNNF